MGKDRWCEEDAIKNDTGTTWLTVKEVLEKNVNVVLLTGYVSHSWSEASADRCPGKILEKSQEWCGKYKHQKYWYWLDFQTTFDSSRPIRGFFYHCFHGYKWSSAELSRKALVCNMVRKDGLL